MIANNELLDISPTITAARIVKKTHDLHGSAYALEARQGAMSWFHLESFSTEVAAREAFELFIQQNKPWRVDVLEERVL